MNYETLSIYRTETIESLWLVLTYRCQFNCEWCYTRNGNIQQDMKLEDALIACQMLAELGGENIILIGGEPLLYPHLIPIVQECSKLNLNTILITNGYSLEKEENVIRLKKAGLSCLTLSLKKRMNHFHGSLADNRGSFQSVNKFLINLNKNKLSYEISCLIDDKKCDSFKKLIQWASIKEIPLILFQTYVPPPGTDTYPDYLPSPKETAGIIEELYKASLEISNVRCQFTFQYPFCLLDENILDSMLNDDVLYGSHEILFMGRGVALDPLGNFLPSSHWVGFPLFHSDEIRENGHLSPQKFLDKWNSEKVLIFRKNLWENLSLASRRCNDCKLWPSRCVGGNPLVWQVWNEKDLLPEVL